jgi:SRSO17 transposase
VTPPQIKKLERELDEYIEWLTDGMGRSERREALGLYLTGLLLDGDRKSIEPLAARLVDDASEIEGMRQRLQQCVSVSKWAEREVFRRVAIKVDAELPEIEAFVIDDTGFAKKGEHSVGVTRQYSGTLGRVENCQVATSVHLAGELGSACVGLRLYLPEEWANDRRRCRKVSVPADVVFQTKWQIAIDLLDEALSAGVRSHIVLADSGYGDGREFRNAIRERGLEYAVGVHHTTVVWRPETRFEMPPPNRMGRPRQNLRAVGGKAAPIGELAKKLTYRSVTWRQGTRGKQSSRFAAARVRTAHGHANHPGTAPGPEEWLLCEWPAGEAGPTKHYLISLPTNTPIRELVRVAKLRWRVERDYQDLKTEAGLDHFEGRSWPGFHHHAALCAAAHAFLALRRALFPPEHDPLDASDGAEASAATPASPFGSLPALSATL